MNSQEPTVPEERKLVPPIRPWVYVAMGFAGLLLLSMMMSISRCGSSAQHSTKGGQSSNPTIARPESIEGYSQQQQADIAKLNKQASDTKAVLARAKNAYDAMTNSLPCDATLAGTRGTAADGQPIVCGQDGLWRPIAAQPATFQIDPIQANPAADASARRKQAGVDTARQAKDAEAARKLAALQSSTIAIDFTDRSASSAPPATRPTPATTADAKLPVPDTHHEPPPAPTKAKYEWNQFVGKTYKIPEGTIFETVLTNRVNGSASGPINTMFTTDIWSHDHQQLLIPQGTRCLGTVGSVNSGTQQRLYVAFHRCIMPDLYSLDLDKFAGLNQIGETGLRDQVNHHYLQIFGASLAVGAVAGIAQIGNSTSGFGYDPSVAIRNGISQSLAQESIHILDKFLNQLPTFTIRERARVKIYLTADIDVPSYDAHRVDPAL